MEIVAFGNSITQGAFDNECGGWVNRLAAHVYAKDIASDLQDRSTVFNLGVQGEDIKGIQARFEDELSRRIEDEERGSVLLAVGVNDGKYNNSTKENWTPLEEYTEALQVMINIAKTRHYVAIVGLVSIDETNLDPMPWNPEFSYREIEVKRYDKALENKAKENGCIFISMCDIFENDKRLLIDGIHPNAEGHRLMFERVKSVLEQENIL